MINCGFDDNFAFCLTLPDAAYQREGDEEESPGCLAQLPVGQSEFVPICWVHKNGTTRRIRSAVQRTIGAEDGFRPIRVETEFVDEKNEDYVVIGDIVNSFTSTGCKTILFPAA